MKIIKNNIQKSLIVSVLAVAMLIVLGASSARASSVVKYHPNENARNFKDNNGGWKFSNKYEGLCLPSITCPSVQGSYQANGGYGGANDGYLRSSLGSLLGVASESQAIYTSPTFTYRGVNNSKADALRLVFDRRSDINELLEMTGNSVSTDVEVIKASNNSVVSRPVQGEEITDNGSWASGSSAVLANDSLTLGTNYKLRFITTFNTGTDAVAGGTVDYDSIVLTAIDNNNNGSDGNNGGNGNNGNNGGNGGNGNNGGNGVGAGPINSMTNKEFKAFGKTAFGAGANRAVYKNGKLFIKVQCARKAKTACQYYVRGFQYHNKKGKKFKRPLKVTNRRYIRSRSDNKIRRAGVVVKNNRRAFVKRQINRKYRVSFRVKFKARGRTTVFNKKFFVIKK